MTRKQYTPPKGLTFVEIIIATFILVIIVLGASAFRYSAALGARQSERHMTAARTALLLCEGWRSMVGSEIFDPVAKYSATLAIETDGDGPPVPVEFTKLANYKVVINDVNYYATLSWKDLSATLRALTVEVAWENRNAESGEYEADDKSVSLTTYTNLIVEE